MEIGHGEYFRISIGGGGCISGSRRKFALGGGHARIEEGHQCGVIRRFGACRIREAIRAKAKRVERAQLGNALRPHRLIMSSAF